MSHNHEGIDPK